MPNNILRNPILRYFTSFLIVSLTSFINELDFLSDLAIFMISFISLFEIINVLLPDPNNLYG